MLKSYLSNGKQRTKINDAYSIVKFCSEFHKADIRPLLFNIYICDLFYDTDDCYIASYVDDNTPYASSNNLDALINKPEESTTAYFSGLEIIT